MEATIALQSGLKSIQKQMFPEMEPSSADIEFPAPTPLYLKKEHVAVKNMYSTIPGKSSQIVCVESLIHPDFGYEGGVILPSPTFILLNKPHPNFSMTWLGWMVRSEYEYMTEFDVLLNCQSQKEDCCKFVQTWNQVMVYIPTVHRVAGFVELSLFKNIACIATQFSFGAEAGQGFPSTDIPNRQVKRSMPFGEVITGSYLNESDKTDPRCDYSYLCGHYATLFSDSIDDLPY